MTALLRNTVALFHQVTESIPITWFSTVVTVFFVLMLDKTKFLQTNSEKNGLSIFRIGSSLKLILNSILPILNWHSFGFPVCQSHLQLNSIFFLTGLQNYATKKCKFLFYIACGLTLEFSEIQSSTIYSSKTARKKKKNVALLLENFYFFFPNRDLQKN